MVLPDSHKIPRVPWYLGAPYTSQKLFAEGALTRYGSPFQMIWLNNWFITCDPVGRPDKRSPESCKHDCATPTMQRLPAITHHRFRLFRVRSPLLTESLLFSIRPATKMFQFTGCPLPTLCVQVGVLGGDTQRVTPFGYPRIKARLQLPEAFRRLPRPSSAFCPKASTARPL